MVNPFYTLSQIFTMPLQDRYLNHFLKSCGRKTQKCNPGTQRSERLQHVPRFSRFSLGQCSFLLSHIAPGRKGTQWGADAIRLQSTGVAHEVTLGSSGCSTILWRLIFPSQHKLNTPYSLVYDKIMSFNWLIFIIAFSNTDF